MRKTVIELESETREGTTTTQHKHTTTTNSHSLIHRTLSLTFRCCARPRARSSWAACTSPTMRFTASACRSAKAAVVRPTSCYVCCWGGGVVGCWLEEDGWGLLDVAGNGPAGWSGRGRGVACVYVWDVSGLIPIARSILPTCIIPQSTCTSHIYGPLTSPSPAPPWPWPRWPWRA